MSRQITVQQQDNRLYLLAPRVELVFSLQTGQWLSWRDKASGFTTTIASEGDPDLRLITNGQEHRPPPRREPYYTDTDTITAPGQYRKYRLADEGRTHALYIDIEHENWLITHIYRVYPESGILSHELDITCTGESAATIRGLALQARLSLHAEDGWHLMLPGWDGQPPDQLFSQIPVDTRLTSVDAPFINIGLAGFRTGQHNILAWSFSHTDSIDLSLKRTASGILLEHQIKVAERLQPGESMRTGAQFWLIHEGEWSAALETFQNWYAAFGLHTPFDKPNWTRAAAIYEVHIGTAVFRDNFSYTPFPEISDLFAHLPHIQAMGFDTIQIMPRQPYPCYAVHDYYDISTSYGDEAQLRDLVQAAHQMGIRVILDVLMHGVMDQEIINEVELSVQTVQDDYWPELRQTVIDFAPYWRSGSYPRHPISEQHPDWFMQTESGRVASIYTKAFDLANRDMQDYFIAALEYLIRTLDIDGFRFDAPNWNSFPDWNPDRSYRASYSTFASIELFRRARQQLRKLKPDLLFYTESSGPLFRESFDLNYNYDEQWLIPAVMSGRITASQMAFWFDQRRRAMPPGFVTAHHVDSHDTFWWMPPGKKWRREQFGLPAAKALVAVLALIDGAFMNYVGGEDGQVDYLSRLLRLRRVLPELHQGACSYTTVSCDHDTVFTTVRGSGANVTVIAINLSPEAIGCTLSLDTAQIFGDNERRLVFDAISEDRLMILDRDALERFPLQLAAFQACAFVIRPVDSPLPALSGIEDRR